MTPTGIKRARQRGVLHQCWKGLIAALGIAAALLVLQAGSAAAATDPGGMVYGPVTGDVFSGVGQNRLITFYGYILFPQNITKVSVDVLRDATRDPKVDSSWRKDAMITTAIDTSSGYGFFSMRGYPFDSVSWPDGGTARARVRWTRTDGNSDIMLSWDVNFNANPGNIITVTDADPAPAIANPLGYLDNRRGVPHFTSQSSAQTDETRKYYQSVRTNPDGTGSNMYNTITTLAAFKRRYFAGLEDVNALYFNRGDLGLGRNMHCAYNPNTRETACYVRNFAPPDPDNPKLVQFNKPAEAFLLMDKELFTGERQAFATVAMVERGQMPQGAPNKVFFAVYNGDERLETVGKPIFAQLDSKGYNTFIPGNCMVCHANGGSYRTTGTATKEVINAFFLPFDLQAFDFSSGHTRAAQEESFRKLNYLVDRTDIKFNNYSHNVILGWYHNSATQTLGVPGSKFVDDTVPTGWRGNSNDMSVYKHVIAPQCRTCHISQPPGSALDFDTAAEFREKKDLVVGLQCGNHLMPNAERTLELSWANSSRAILMNYFGVRLECKP